MRNFDFVKVGMDQITERKLNQMDNEKWKN